MPTLKNVSPLGDLDVPLLGRVLSAGEEFECSAEQAERLGAPNENYELLNGSALAAGATGPIEHPTKKKG